MAVKSGKQATLQGQKGTQGLLAVRAIAGSIGMILLYQSIIMLPLADAVMVFHLCDFVTRHLWDGWKIAWP